MKLLLDQNISHKLLPRIEPLSPGSRHVRHVALGTADDQTIWEFARANGFIIVSCDSDYFEISMERGAPPFVIWLDLKNPSTERTLRTLLAIATQLPDLFEREGRSCLHVKGVGIRRS